MTSSPPLPAPASAAFHTTRWTVVCLAKAGSDEGRHALADLCSAYYEPVVAFLRRVMRDADVARELGHAFFAEVLAGGQIGTADPARGRFRSYLLGAVKHFVSRERERAQTLKRGGGRAFVSLDAEEASAVPDGGQPSPDAAFDHQWALTVLERGLRALRQECQAEGRAAFFDHVRPLLTGEGNHGAQAEVAAACGMSIEAFRMALHRLKKRLRQCVKAEVAGTLGDAACVADEMQVLMEALGGKKAR